MVNDIKLIIWDLDNTFWQGILSEEEIIPVRQNMDLVRLAVDKGIMNSICSKNDHNQARQMLESEKLDGIWDQFVFPSIDWTPKGPRLKQQIADIALRAENVLFIDDEPANLREAEAMIPGIHVTSPEIKQIREAFSDTQGVTLINVTDFITGQDCFDGSTNHFSKLVYYKMAERIECMNAS